MEKQGKDCPAGPLVSLFCSWFFNHISIFSPFVCLSALSFHDYPNKVLGKDHKPHKLLVPTPLVLANGNAQLLKKTEHKQALLVNAPQTAAVSSHQSSGLLTSPDGTAKSAPNPGRHEPNVHSSSKLNDLPPSFIPEPPVKPDSSIRATAKDNLPKSNSNARSDQKHKSVSPNMPMELLPPPSDFMDEPVLLPPVHTLPAGQSQAQTSTQLSSRLASQLPPQPCQSQSMPIAPPPGFNEDTETNKPVASLSTSPRERLSPDELEKLRKKASVKKAPEKLPVVLVKPGHDVSDQENSPTFGPDTSVVAVAEYGEPKSPPIVAPKPKKLPSSIVLKSHKEATPGHSLISPGDRMVINQQKVHQEALKKLGLLKNEETNSGLCPSPPHKASPKTSFNTHTSAASPSAEPNAEPGHAEHHGVLEAQGKTDFSFLPAHPEGENLLITRAPSPKLFEMKSASMERSGVGLKNLTLENPSQKTCQEESLGNVALAPGHLRNNRSRPASEGNWKNFSIDQIPSDSNRDPEPRRSLTISALAQPKAEPQKPLRSHGISVVISPQSKSGEDRKQALKRLGLIKD